MAALSRIVKVTVSSSNVAVKRASFGVAAIIDGHTRFNERIRFYTEPADMLTDGFLSTDAAYLAALKLCSQSPRVAQFAIARRALMPTLKIELTPTVLNNKTYTVEINGVAKSFTSDGTATLGEITAGLVAAIGAITGFTVTDTGPGTKVTILGSAAGNWVRVRAVDPTSLKVEQTHADPGIATDLAAIALENPAWYGACLTTASKAEIVAAAAWFEANKRILVQGTQDSDVVNTVLAGATDVAATLKTSSYKRTATIYHADNGEFIGAALLGRCFPRDPGSISFALKSLAGVAADTLSETQIQNATDKNANYYAAFGDQPLLMNGLSAQGEYLDVTRDSDWYESRLQARIFGDLAAADKTPFTTAGIAKVEAQMRAQAEEAIKAGFLANDPAPTFIVPAISDIATLDKQARKLTGLKTKATIAGAIHSTELEVSVSV
jgi:hypothetical protein